MNDKAMSSYCELVESLLPVISRACGNSNAMCLFHISQVKTPTSLYLVQYLHSLCRCMRFREMMARDDQQIFLFVSFFLSSSCEKYHFDNQIYTILFSFYGRHQQPYDFREYYGS